MVVAAYAVVVVVALAEGIWFSAVTIDAATDVATIDAAAINTGTAGFAALQ